MATEQPEPDYTFYMKPLTRATCPNCQTVFEFLPQRGTKRVYCSDDCQRRAAYQRDLQHKIEDQSKWCPRCSETKPLSEFSGGSAAYCRPCMAVYARERYRKNTERILGYARTTNLRRYGLTMADFDRMLAEQGGVCAICGATEPGGQGKWHVDHDHSCCNTRKISCGKCIRGLLCSRCNIGIGNFADDPARIRAAADYLDAHAARRAGHVLAPAV